MVFEPEMKTSLNLDLSQTKRVFLFEKCMFNCLDGSLLTEKY